MVRSNTSGKNGTSSTPSRYLARHAEPPLLHDMLSSASGFSWERNSTQLPPVFLRPHSGIFTERTHSSRPLRSACGFRPYCCAWADSLWCVSATATGLSVLRAGSLSLSLGAKHAVIAKPPRQRASKMDINRRAGYTDAGAEADWDVRHVTSVSVANHELHPHYRNWFDRPAEMGSG